MYGIWCIGYCGTGAGWCKDDANEDARFPTYEEAEKAISLYLFPQEYNRYYKVLSYKLQVLG